MERSFQIRTIGYGPLEGFTSKKESASYVSCLAGRRNFSRERLSPPLRLFSQYEDDYSSKPPENRNEPEYMKVYSFEKRRWLQLVEKSLEP